MPPCLDPIFFIIHGTSVFFFLLACAILTIILCTSPKPARKLKTIDILFDKN